MKTHRTEDLINYPIQGAIQATLAELRDELHGTVEPSPVIKVDVPPHQKPWIGPDLTSCQTLASRCKAICERMAELAREHDKLLQQLIDLS